MLKRKRNQSDSNEIQSDWNPNESRSRIEFHRHILTEHFNDTNKEKKCDQTKNKKEGDEAVKALKEKTGRNNITYDHVKIDFEHICCADLIPTYFYTHSWNVYLQWGPTIYKKLYLKTIEEKREKMVLPVFMPESTKMLETPPYKHFTPDNNNSIFGTAEIKYRFHECRCRLKHCLLRNTFPTYHPDTGVIVSVVNHKCVKSHCSNAKKDKAKDYPNRNRNCRQIVVWEKDWLDMFEEDEFFNSVLTEKYLGRIVICLNHFSIEDQIYFWKHGFLRKEAQLRTFDITITLKEKYKKNLVLKHKVSIEGFSELHMLPIPNPDLSKRALYPTDESPPNPPSIKKKR